MYEQQIQTKILKYLKSIGAYSIKTVVSNRRGIPDIIACIDGCFYAFEIKTNKGRILPLQEYELLKIKKAGGISSLVRSVEDVKKTIQNNINKLGKA